MYENSAPGLLLSRFHKQIWKVIYSTIGYLVLSCPAGSFPGVCVGGGLGGGLVGVGALTLDKYGPKNGTHN